MRDYSSQEWEQIFAEMEADAEKPVPSVPHSEQVVIVAIERDNTLIERFALSEHAFNDVRHKQLFRLIQNHGMLLPEQMEWKLWDYFFNISRSVVFSNLEAYCQQLKEKQSLNSISAAVANPKLLPDQKLEMIKMQASYAPTGEKPIDDLGYYFREVYLPQVHSQKAINSKFCIPWLDKEVELRRGGVNFIGARPGTGKTALACQLINNSDEPVYFFSLEMAPEAIHARLWANKSQTIHKRLLDGNSNEIAKAMQYAPNFKPNLVIDNKSFRIDDICTRIGEYSKKCSVFIIDHTKLIVPRKAKAVLWESITDNIQSLKRCAVEHEVAIVCLNQMTRGSDQRSELYMSDMAGASAVEETADWILMLQNEEGVTPTNHDKYVGIQIAKNRYGTVGKCPKLVGFWGGQQRFEQTLYDAPEPKTIRDEMRGNS